MEQVNRRVEDVRTRQIECVEVLFPRHVPWVDVGFYHKHVGHYYDAAARHWYTNVSRESMKRLLKVVRKLMRDSLLTLEPHPDGWTAWV